jgi:hypothetical protein
MVPRRRTGCRSGNAGPSNGQAQETRAGCWAGGAEQVAVVGFDDIFPGSLYDPPLTTVHQPMRLLGERACTRLLDRIARPGLRPKAELLPTELVLRSSCGCPPGTVIRQPVRPLRAGRAAPSPRTAPPGTPATARRGRRKNPDAAD